MKNLDHIALQAAEQAQQADPVAWKHDCAALLMNDVELWVRNCPHCGKPRAAQQAQWLPIETAPADRPFLAVLDCAGERTICTMRLSVAKQKNSVPNNGDFNRERVTHWMPLPPEPKK